MSCVDFICWNYTKLESIDPVYRIMMSANRDDLISSNSNLYLFELIFLPMAVANTSRSIQNSRCKSGHLCLLPNLSGDTCNISHSIWWWLCVCHILPWLSWGMFLLQPNCLRFLSWKDVILHQVLYHTCWYNYMVFILQSVHVTHHIYSFACVETNLHTREKITHGLCE